MRVFLLSPRQETHDQVPIFNSWPVTSAWFGEGSAKKKKKSIHGETNGRTERHAFSKPKLRSFSFKIQRSIIFYSNVDSNYCLFPEAVWMCNFFHLLRRWKFDSQRIATAVLATIVMPLRQCPGFQTAQPVSTHASAVIFLPSLCHFPAPLCVDSHRAHLSLCLPIFAPLFWLFPILSVSDLLPCWPFLHL